MLLARLAAMQLG